MQKLFIKIFYIIGILPLCLSVNGQKDTTFNFKNQGEQENYWAKEKFRIEYKKENFKRYDSLIKELDTTTYKYGSQIFKVIESSNVIRQLFKLGILYPSLVSTYSKADSLKDRQKVFKNPFKTDTFRVSNIEELKFLEKSPRIKRFRLWLHWNGVANPFVYLFELTNESATQQTDMDEFIKGATLTFFKQGWIVI